MLFCAKQINLKEQKLNIQPSREIWPLLWTPGGAARQLGAAVRGAAGKSTWKKKKSPDRKGTELRIHNLTANYEQTSCRGFLSPDPQIYSLAGVICTQPSKLGRFLLRRIWICTQPRIFTRSKNYQSFISLIGPRCCDFFISHRWQKYNRFTEHICWLFICRVEKKGDF